jgi:hypothetical protein
MKQIRRWEKVRAEETRRYLGAVAEKRGEQSRTEKGTAQFASAVVITLPA